MNGLVLAAAGIDPGAIGTGAISDLTGYVAVVAPAAVGVGIAVFGLKYVIGLFKGLVKK